MQPGQDNDRSAGIDLSDNAPGGGHLEVERFEPRPSGVHNVLHLAKTFPAQQILCNKLGRDAGRFSPADSDPRRLRRRFRGGDRRWSEPEQAGSGHERGLMEEFPAIHTFSSFLSSLMKRQSVLCAMNFWGVDVI